MKTKFIKFCILNRIILIRSNKIKTTLYTNNIVICNKIEFFLHSAKWPLTLCVLSS